MNEEEHCKRREYTPHLFNGEVTFTSPPMARTKRAARRITFIITIMLDICIIKEDIISSC